MMWQQTSQTLVLVLFIIYSSCAQNTTCPCEYDESSQKADCFFRGLNTVPDCVPNNTVHLNLGSNNLTYHSRQFERFSALEHLDLSGNPFDDLRNDTFVQLPALIVLLLGSCNFTIIERHFFNGLSNLRNLSLELNRIEKLQITSFELLENLIYLDLSYNEIDNIKDGVLQKLSSLVQLDLSHNPSNENTTPGSLRCMSFQNQSFTGLAAVKYLLLSDVAVCNATSFPVDVFQPLTSLEKLNLKNFCRPNSVTNYSCPNLDERLEKAPSIRTLLLDTEIIDNLGPGFEQLPFLEYIHFSTSYAGRLIESISNATFEYLKFSRLSSFILDSWNLAQVEHILPYTFSNLKNLTVLDISFISNFGNDSFHNIFIGLQSTKIKRLRLSVKCPSPITVQSDILAHIKNTSLEELDLSESNIASIWDADVVSQLPDTIKSINLQRNEIGHFNTTLLYILEHLESLDLSFQNHDIIVRRSSENYFSSNSFDDTKRSDSKRSSINVPNNILHLQDIELREIQEECYPLPFRLQSLDISHSPLFNDIATMFCNPNNSLEYLDVSNQYWSSLMFPEEEFTKFWENITIFTRLKNLNLNGNRIKHIPTDAFSTLTFLEYLSVSNNVLSIASFDVGNLMNIKLIDLSDNAIQNASDSFIEQIEILGRQTNVSLHLDKNPLVCNCNTINTVKWFNKTELVVQKDTLSCQYINETQLSLSRVQDIYNELQSHCSE